MRLQEMPPANLLQLLIRRPRPKRHLELRLVSVHKPRRIDQPLLHLPDPKRAARLLAGGDVVRRSLPKNVPFWDGVIIRPPVDAVLYLFQPAARLEAFEDTDIQLGLVSDGAVQTSDVDEVEVVLWKRPG